MITTIFGDSSFCRSPVPNSARRVDRALRGVFNIWLSSFLRHSHVEFFAKRLVTSAPVEAKSDLVGGPLLLSRSGFWPLQNMGWFAFFLVHWLSGVAHNKSSTYIGMSITMAITGWCVTLLLHRVYSRLWQHPLARLVPAVLPWFVAAVVTISVANSLVTADFCPECKPVRWWGYLTYAGFASYVLLSWTGLWFGIKNSRAYQRAQAQTIAAQAQANLAQLKMLRYQLNPHFLFNTLNAISTLTMERDSDTAERMLSGLARFLRYTLEQEPQQKVTLAREVEMLRLYLDIETLRFSDRFAVEFAIDPQALDALIPSLLLQPLVENTTKHAVAKSESACVLRINARVESQHLVLALCDNGPVLTNGSQVPGVGLRNTAERLQTLYGADHSLQFGPGDGAGFAVRIHLPLERA
jgi:two-component system, LytTR family, sensor kinase